MRSAQADHEATDPGLKTVIEAWPDLPEPVKTGILAMVQTAVSADPNKPSS